MIIDTHAHYDDEAFDEDRASLLSSFPELGIERIINVGASMEGSLASVALSKEYPFIYSAVGAHPDSALEITPENIEKLRTLLQDEKCLAVGEIGLDYHSEDLDIPLQQKAFRMQLSLAKEMDKPVIIHSRDAAKDTLDILLSDKTGERGAVMHCYSYSKETAEILLKHNFYFGIGGVITFKNAKKLVEALEIIPMDRILLETDCPYLAPTPYRGTRNSSAYIPLMIERIAQIKGVTEKEVEEITTENALRLFFH